MASNTLAKSERHCIEINRDLCSLTQDINAEISVLKLVAYRFEENIRGLQEGVESTDAHAEFWNRHNLSFD